MRHLTALVAMVLIGFASGSAAAQGRVLCGQRDNVVASLENKFSESRISVGLANNGAVIEVYASKKGSFTIIVSQPNGLSCLIAAGQNWETLQARLSGFET